MNQDFHDAMATHMALIKKIHAREMRKLIAAVERCERKGIQLPDEPIQMQGLRLAAENGKRVRHG